MGKLTAGDVEAAVGQVLTDRKVGHVSECKKVCTHKIFDAATEVIHGVKTSTPQL